LQCRNPKVVMQESGFPEDALTAIQLPFYRPTGSDTGANRHGSL